MTKIHFIKTGFYTTIQDGGRDGYQNFGVPKGGYLDCVSAGAANTIVGNGANVPLLEIAEGKTEILFSGDDNYVALTGADLNAEIDGVRMERYKQVPVEEGSLITFGKSNNGNRAYLAIQGEWKIPLWLGSASVASFNAEEFTPGSILKTGVTVEVKNEKPIKKNSSEIYEIPQFKNVVKVEVIPGPEYHLFSNLQVNYFQGSRHRLTRKINRMGYRMASRLPFFRIKNEMWSSGIIPGTVQISGLGQPIILLTDSQTTGGYPRIAVIKEKYLPLLAQMKPGDIVEFKFV